MVLGRPLTVLERGLSRLGGSWLVLSICLLGLQLGLFFVSTQLDTEPLRISSLLDGLWLAPVVTLMICLLHSLFNRRFGKWVMKLRPRLALSDRAFRNYLYELTLGKGRLEVAALAIGALSGFFIDQPWSRDLFWQSWLYRAPTRAIMASLVVWFVLVAVNRTQALSAIHREPASVSLKNLGSADPVVLWSLEVSAAILGLFLLSWALLIHSPIRNRFLFFSGALLIIVLIFLLSRAFSLLFSSIYQSRILYAVILVLATAAMGTLGYRLLEGWGWLDGFYMTIITMTTVGYGEIHELTEDGRLFTIFLMITSIGIGGYALSTVAGYVVEGEFNRVFRGRRMQKKIEKLKNHIILCGAGRIGREIAGEFYQTLTPFVLIDTREDNLKRFSHLKETPHLIGDCTHDEILMKAGVERARGLVASLSEDQANVFLVLGVRALNPQLRIIARLNNDENRKKLLRAGADEVVHPESIGGLRMASMIIRPSVVTFLDQMLRASRQTLRVEEVAINEHMAGHTLEQVRIPERTGLLIVAMKSGIAAQYRFNPMPDTQLEVGDVLIVMGNPQQLAKARELTVQKNDPSSA